MSAPRPETLEQQTSEHQRRIPRVVLPYACALLSILLMLCQNRPAPEWTGFRQLEWGPLEGFVKGQSQLNAPHLPPSEPAVIGWPNPGPSPENRRAESKAFLIGGAIMRISVAGFLAPNFSKPPTIAVVGEDGTVYADTSIPLAPESINHTSWMPFEISLPESSVGKKARIIVRTKPSSTPGGWFAVRERADFFESTLFGALGSSAGFYPLAALFAISAGFLFVRWSAKKKPRAASLGLFVALGVLFQLRASVFFYWDEWHVLERFSQLGLSGVLYTHNEHFLPLFFLFYFIEAKLLGDSYLGFIAVSLVLHALNGLLLYRLLLRLADGRAGSKGAAFALSTAFIASALHGESLQWSFEQSLLLCQACILGASIFAWDAVRKGGKLQLFGAAACCLAAPLCFGNGFLAVVQACLIGLIAVLTRSEAVLHRDGIPLVTRRLLPLAALCAAGVLFSAFLYSRNQVSTGHGTTDLKPLENVGAVISYVYAGTQVGAVLRGLGVFPVLQLGAPSKLLAAAGLSGSEPEVFMAHLGLTVNLLILFAIFYSCRRPDRGGELSYGCAEIC